MVRLVFYPLFNNEEDLFSPLKALDQLSDSVISAVRQADNKTKQVSLDRSPSCAIGDCVEVSAKHEEDSEDGSSYVKREFTRRFTLPEGVKAETVTCALSSSGVLAIEAPKPEVPSKKPRMIPITVESPKPIEAASEESNKEAQKQKEGAAPAS
ncbi:hypothetical protein MRX96_042464 [Rhipicephalus microplus]